MTVEPLTERRSTAIIESLMNLPRRPDRPISGQGFARFKFPTMDGYWRRVWAGVPSAHKDDRSQTISPEAYNTIAKFL